MKIKHYIFTLFLLCFSNFLTAAPLNSEVCGDGLGGDDTRPRSPVLVTTSTVDATRLQASFRLKYKKVNVTIKDEYRSVHYQSTLSVPESNKVTIDITMLPAGAYTIEYADENSSVVGSDKFTTR